MPGAIDGVPNVRDLGGPRTMVWLWSASGQQSSSRKCVPKRVAYNVLHRGPHIQSSGSRLLSTDWSNWMRATCLCLPICDPPQTDGEEPCTGRWRLLVPYAGL
mmetsp:Transcript_136296/g.265105  ORF Transcript_136296/g.265105 Transcript_136296/m.265105 type:complete len:103 (+) Transcript_136296:1499-1807(+)